MMKTRRYLRMAAALLSALLLLFSAPAFGEDYEADIYFENGVIYTVDDRETVAEALAVKDGRIVFVGSRADGEVYRDTAASVVDLQGNMMLPGLIDSHLHSVMPSFFDFDLLEAVTQDEILAEISAYVEANPEKERYSGFGYMTSAFTGDEAEKGPRKEHLDAICPDKPLLIMSFDGHTLWVNSRFFEAHDITYDTASPRGGVVEKDDEKGELWGTLKDAAGALAGDEIYDEKTLVRELPNFISALNSYGYTSIMTLPAYGMLPVPFEAYRALEDAGELTIKVHGATSVMEFRMEEDLKTMVETKAQYESDMVKVNTAKFFMDGVLDTRTAYLLAPYDDVPDSYGMAAWDPELLKQAYTKVNEAGFQIHTHAIGDGALRMSLDATQYAKQHAPEGDYRNAVTHLQIVDEADIPRLGELNMVAVIQPYWHYIQPGYTDVVEYPAVGERLLNEYPVKSFQDAGAVIASSSDYPVTPDPTPFQAIQIGVTRNMPYGAEELAQYDLEPITDMDDPAYLLGPEERLSVQEMIRSYTANGAYLLFAEEETGTLEKGKAADLIVIDQNLLKLDPLKIAETQVLQTYVNGQLVYQAE